MPQFNVITINEKHLAKVNAVRKEVSVNTDYGTDINKFLKWRYYIVRQLANTKALTSIIVKHIFE